MFGRVDIECQVYWRHNDGHLHPGLDSIWSRHNRHSSHLRFLNVRTATFSNSPDPEGKGVLICKLRRGQELRMKCIAKKVSTLPFHRNPV